MPSVPSISWDLQTEKTSKYLSRNINRTEHRNEKFPILNIFIWRETDLLHKREPTSVIGRFFFLGLWRSWWFFMPLPLDANNINSIPRFSIWQIDRDMRPAISIPHSVTGPSENHIRISQRPSSGVHSK
jgi:hypothetical protein